MSEEAAPEEDCKVCKKLFTNKNPNIMTENAHTVMKCMASDVDSSDSCLEKGQDDRSPRSCSESSSAKSQGDNVQRSPDAVSKDKPVPKKRLNVKPESVVKLLTYEGDSSDSCSERGQRLDGVKVKDSAVSQTNLATKPPTVKSVKSQLDAKNHSDTEKSNGKHLTRERRSKSTKKTPAKQNENLDSENQSKRSHLQHIIDEAMDHFQKLAAKPTVPDLFKHSRKDKEERVESIQNSDNLDKQKVEPLGNSVELERVITPDRPSSRENTISPIRKHLVLPGTDSRSSPSGSNSGSRRKLPQPPAQNRLRCSVTTFVHSSVDSDSSRPNSSASMPNSSAEFSDKSDFSSASKSDSSNNVANVSVCRSVDETVNRTANDGIDFGTTNASENSGSAILSKQMPEIQAVSNIDHTKTTENGITRDHSDSKKEENKQEHAGGITKWEESGKDTEKKELGSSCDKTADLVELNESAVSLNETDISIDSCDSKTETSVILTDNQLSIEDSSVRTMNSSKDGLESLTGVVCNQNEISSDRESAMNNRTVEKVTEKTKSTNHKHVTRSPSYRKKVMAKARSRYHTQLQSIRCQSGECKENCSICGSQNNEAVPRSHTSLGVPRTDLNEEQYLEQSSPRRACTPEVPSLALGKNLGSERSLKKVPVSSRVDILMSNNLFKKHLSKHENILQKHTLSYRKFGIQKAVSNLDLSEGYLFDEASANDEHNETENNGDSFLNSSLNFTSSGPKDTSRRYSLTGENDFSLSELKDTEKQEGNVAKSLATIHSVDSHKTSRHSRQSQIPSFEEFRRNRSQKRRILPNHTAIRESNNITSQHIENSNQKNCDNDINKHNITYVAEVSEISYSQGHLDTIDESIVNEDKKQLLVNRQSIENVPPVTNEGEKPVISEDVKSESKGSENAIGINIELVNERTTECSDSLLIESLDSEDKSPLSTSEMDSLIIPSRRAYSETDSVGSQDLSYSDLSSSEVSNRSTNKSATKERHRKGAKRPRSLISKKSSLVSLIKENERKQEVSVAAGNRPTVKRGNSLNNLMKIDNKQANYDLPDRVDKVDSFRSVCSEGSHERSVETDALQNKGDKSEVVGEGDHSVNFTLEIDTKSEAGQDVKELDEASLSESAVSESFNPEVNNFVGDNNSLFNETFEFEVYDEAMVRPKVCKDDSNTPVLRSTSDACDATPEALKKRRERKERPYKSDPFSGTEIIPASKRYSIREERARLRQHRSFANSSREEILDFLDVVSTQGQLEPAESFPSLEELNEDDEQNLSMSDVTTDSSKKIRNILRTASTTSTDSGVIGQEESHDSQQSSPSSTLTLSQRLSWPEFRHQAGNQTHISASCSDLTKTEMDGCLDCGHNKKHDIQTVLQICSRCYQRRVERKKTFQEIIETEVNYGRDLNILKEEFYVPMKKTCLLNKDQLDSIFLNLDELIHVNTYFLGKLRSAVNTANHNNDEDLQDVRIGSLFLESSSMFLTFENYCVNQAQAPILLEQLEREKELLRIFLHVSQSENHLLRRMHLKSFLMVPVQRIMKYPMLLDRLYKATPSKHEDKDAIKEAKEKIEDILGHINAKSKVSITGSIKQSHKRKLSERHCSMTEKIEVLRVALESLGWSRKDVCDVITSRLQVAVPVDHTWAAKKCKNLKFTSVLGVLLTHGEPSFEQSDKNLVFPNSSSVQSAAVVLIREKNGKYQTARDPLMLEKCVVSQDPDFTEVFEVLEWSKESLLIKAESQNETNQWVCYLRQQMQQLGCWRKRRNALPNILLNHVGQ